MMEVDSHYTLPHNNHHAHGHYFGFNAPMSSSFSFMAAPSTSTAFSFTSPVPPASSSSRPSTHNAVARPTLPSSSFSSFTAPSTSTSSSTPSTPSTSPKCPLGKIRIPPLCQRVLHHNISLDDEYDADDDGGDEFLNGIRTGAPRRIAGSRRVMRRLGTPTPSPSPTFTQSGDMDVTMGGC
ncbi:hypothetical protein PM082_006833 [Marasmius tenuissimus]|nr:hypothetical protein PM082_006833 [Marasmius tenuissimus]